MATTVHRRRQAAHERGLGVWKDPRVKSLSGGGLVELWQPRRARRTVPLCVADAPGAEKRQVPGVGDRQDRESDYGRSEQVERETVICATLTPAARISNAAPSMTATRSAKFLRFEGTVVLILPTWRGIASTRIRSAPAMSSAPSADLD